MQLSQKLSPLSVSPRSPELTDYFLYHSRTITLEVEPPPGPPLYLTNTYLYTQTKPPGAG